MFTKCLSAVVMAAAFWPPLSVAAPLSLDAALGLAAQRSAAAQAAGASHSAALASAGAAAQLPDPMLDISIENMPVTGADRFSTTREGMTMKRIGVSQEWLSREKRDARQAAADAMAGRELLTIRTALAEVRLQTALAYVEALYAGRMLELADLNERHAREELETARARLASATTSTQDVLALDAALGMAADDKAQALQQQSAAHVALRRWIGVVPTQLVSGLEPGIPSQEAYVAAHPAVLLMGREIEVAKRATDVMVTNRKPNWTWQVGYGQRSGYSDLLSVGVSIPLPIAPAHRQDREIASKAALVDKAEADLLEARRVAQAEYQRLHSDAERIEARIARFLTEIVRPAEQRTAVASAAYRSSQAPLTAVFEARHAELEARQRLLLLQSELAQARVRLTYKSVTDKVAR